MLTIKAVNAAVRAIAMEAKNLSTQSLFDQWSSHASEPRVTDEPTVHDSSASDIVLSAWEWPFARTSIDLTLPVDVVAEEPPSSDILLHNCMIATYTLTAK